MMLVRPGWIREEDILSRFRISFFKNTPKHCTAVQQLKLNSLVIRILQIDKGFKKADFSDNLKSIVQCRLSQQLSFRIRFLLKTQRPPRSFVSHIIRSFVVHVLQVIFLYFTLHTLFIFDRPKIQLLRHYLYYIEIFFKTDNFEIQLC